MNKILYCIDIDGTIAHAGRRFAEAGAEPSRDNRDEYNAWVKRVQNADTLLEDNPVPGMRELIKALSASRLDGHAIVYLTSREQAWEEVTLAWLCEHNFPSIPLFMRPTGDYRSGVAYKEDRIKELLRAFNCTHAILVDDDEHDSLRIMCDKNGYTFLKCCSGGQKFKITSSTK